MGRARGLPKTPDVKLCFPIAVRCGEASDASGEQNYSLVHWIDSKAMFGDTYTHETENSAQLDGYVNRYGPGMVVYWFGFVESLNSDPDILLCNGFPTHCVLPDGTECH